MTNKKDENAQDGAGAATVASGASSVDAVAPGTPESAVAPLPPVHHGSAPSKTAQKAGMADDATHEEVVAASMDMMPSDGQGTAVEAVPDRTERPIVVEPVGGGELIVRATPAVIEKMYPGSRLVRYDDTGEAYEA